MSCQLIVVSVAPAEAAAALADPPTISSPVIPDAAWPVIWQIIVYVPSDRPDRSSCLVWPGWMSPVVRPLGWISRLCTPVPVFVTCRTPPPEGSMTIFGVNLNSDIPTGTDAAAAPVAPLDEPEPPPPPGSFIAQNAGNSAMTATMNASQPRITLSLRPFGGPPSGGSSLRRVGSRSSMIMVETMPGRAGGGQGHPPSPFGTFGPSAPATPAACTAGGRWRAG